MFPPRFPRGLSPALRLRRCFSATAAAAATASAAASTVAPTAAAAPAFVFPTAAIPVSAGSSVVRRCIAAVYGTPSLPQKLALARETAALWRERRIPLYDAALDADIVRKLQTDQLKPPAATAAAAMTDGDGDASPTNTCESCASSTSDDPSQASVPWVLPSRPPRPQWLSTNVPSARALSIPTNIYILHALAHIELNAVDIYLDTVARFAAVPPSGDEKAALRRAAAVTNDCEKQKQRTRAREFPLTQDSEIMVTVLRPMYNPVVDYTAPLTADTPHPQSFSPPQPRPAQAPVTLPLYEAFADDVLSIVDDEARHFAMVADRLELLTAQAQQQ